MCIGEIRYHTMRGAMKIAGGGRSMTSVIARTLE